MKPTLDYLKSRILVDTKSGIVTWIDATKYHKDMIGKDAGTSRKGSSNNKSYWHIKINGVAIKRSHIVFIFATGRWPDLQIDHINGNSIDDRIENLREATITQNAWNHKKRAKKSDLPMGVRKLKSGIFQARIACNKKTHVFGPFETAESASDFYKLKRKEFFNDYS